MSLTKTWQRAALRYGNFPVDEVPGGRNSRPKDSNAQSRSLQRYFVANLIATVLLALLVLGNNLKRSNPPTISHRHAWTSCGNSSAEALSRDCRFDRMLISWIPKACDFGDFEDDYPPGDFHFYTDKNRTKAISSEEVYTGNYTVVYTHGAYHDLHCTYAWRKLSLALKKRVPLLDTKTADFGHASHCAKGVSEALRDTKAGDDPYARSYSFVPRLFAGCVPLF